MIIEDYVSFETAKLLKEKGFDAPYYYCSRVYSEHGTLQGVSSVKFPNVKYIPAPTLQMAIKWLRKMHKLFIFISPWLMHENSIQYYFEIREIKTSDFETLYDYTSKELNSFEKVAEAAIQYCLKNLI